jgi:hypothetical protein
MARAICRVPSLARVFVRERFRAAHGILIDFNARLEGCDGPSMVSGMSPFIKTMLSSTYTEDDFADHAADHVPPSTSRAIALFSLGLAEDWLVLPKVKKKIRPGLYLITTYHKDGTLRARYVGASSSGAFVGSPAITGVHRRCGIHDRNAIAANPPKLQLYISEDGICNNDYKIGLLLAFDEKEVRKPVAGRLSEEDFTLFLGARQLESRGLRPLLHIHEAASILALGTAQESFMHPLLQDARRESPLAAVSTHGLNRANGLEDFCSDAVWRETIGCAGGWFQVAKGKRREQESLRVLVEGWADVNVSTMTDDSRSESSYTRKWFTCLGVVQFLPMDFPNGKARVYLDMEGPSRDWM